MKRATLSRLFPVLFVSVVVAVCTLLGVSTARAADDPNSGCDWQVGQCFKLHWPQLPDLSSAGSDVSLSSATLADDFLCTGTGPIRRICIWGSFSKDVVPKEGPASLTFELSILADIPADGRTPSRPGQTLWTHTFNPGDYTAGVISDGLEDWYEPVTDLYLPMNHRKAFQYNFCVDEDAFIQEEGTVYWLAVSTASSFNYEFGWKTTSPQWQWNDSASCLPYTPVSDTTAWQAMVYPENHRYAAQPLDLAFVIDSGDGTVAQRDLGDAPDSSNDVAGLRMTAYPGVVANFPTAYQAGLPPYGPMHRQPRDAFYLGAWVSFENQAELGPDEDGVNNINPVSDEANKDGGDDGLQLPVVMPSCQSTTLDYTVTVVSSVAKQPYVNIWCDWNRDGDWDDIVECPDGTQVPEWAVQNYQPVLPGVGVYTLTTPSFLCWHPNTQGSLDPIWIRITISEQPWNAILASGGAGPEDGYKYGETEDYLVVPKGEPTPTGYDWGDAPDDPKAMAYPTLAVHNGASHAIGGPWLGDAADKPDAEADGQPDPNALGDDSHGTDDENGVSIPPLVIGETAAITVQVAGGGGVLQGWIDYNGDHAWSATEKVYNGYLPDGVHILWITVPPDASPGETCARFRISREGNLTPVGPAPDGEVEDLTVRIRRPDSNRKWCQLPDTTPHGIDIRIDNSDDINRAAADDFKCTSRDYLTHVRLWGSWKDDIKGQIKTIRLSIYWDDPVGSPGADKTNLFSKPRPETLWSRSFTADQFNEKLYHVVHIGGEYWWDPATDEVIAGGDTNIWQIDIEIDPNDAFQQEGSWEDPVIYWLAVEVETVEGQFGWKTRQWPDHFMDDAVWDTGSKLPRSWRELRYPEWHPYHETEKNSIDLAFCLWYSSGGPIPTPTIQPVVETQCPVVETKCPVTETRCPAIETRCPVTETECPAVETTCPMVETACHSHLTVCPAVETRCPVTDTQCPTSSTRCPPVETECPMVSTACYPLQTTCPAVETQCPVTSTQCPPATTQCPAVYTKCPLTATACQTIQTACPAVETQCPSVYTQCPAVSTLCPAVETQCPASTTKCPPTETRCPTSETQCPATATKCPASETKCPVVSTQCPVVSTQCPRCVKASGATEQSGWTIVETECPIVKTKCPSIAEYLTTIGIAK
jgi:hypothetical protein